jgi:hypothetical protein
MSETIFNNQQVMHVLYRPYTKTLQHNQLDDFSAQVRIGVWPDETLRPAGVGA